MFLLILHLVPSRQSLGKEIRLAQQGLVSVTQYPSREDLVMNEIELPCQPLSTRYSLLHITGVRISKQENKNVNFAVLILQCSHQKARSLQQSALSHPSMSTARLC